MLEAHHARLLASVTTASLLTLALFVGHGRADVYVEPGHECDWRGGHPVRQPDGTVVCVRSWDGVEVTTDAGDLLMHPHPPTPPAPPVVARTRPPTSPLTLLAIGAVIALGAAGLTFLARRRAPDA